MSIYKGTEFIAGTPDLSDYAKSSDVTSAINSLGSSVVKLSGNQTIAGTKTFSSAVKCAGSATTGTAITTSAISKAQNGYLKLGNGVIIQWGTATSGADVKITLPTAFSSTNYSVTVNSTGGTGEQYARAISSKSTTSFNILSAYAATSYTSNWIAIGY